MSTDSTQADELVIFDGEPLHQLVTGFAVMTAGLTPIFDAQSYGSFLSERAGLYPSQVLGHPLWVNLRPVVEDARRGVVTAPALEQQLCCLVATFAYESAVRYKAFEGRPEAQFLRHVRNASAHGNTWHFDPGYPNLPAVWRSIRIPGPRPQPQPHQWQGELCFGGKLTSGDLLLLLHDIAAIARAPGTSSGP